jgi:hypothetical protein
MRLPPPRVLEVSQYKEMGKEFRQVDGWATLAELACEWSSWYHHFGSVAQNGIWGKS